VAESLDPYKTLQVDPEADDEVIKAAYRGLARKYHPDVAVGGDAAARMAAINAAWDLIGDPETRRRYDQDRKLRAYAAEAAQRDPWSRSPDAADPATGPAGSGGSGAGQTASGSGGSSQADSGGTEAPTDATGSAPPRSTPQPPDQVSGDWTSGRSSQGSAYGPSMRKADGLGAAGPPPGRPSGSVLNFGRYSGWSLGEVAHADIEYIEWLDRTPIGRQYHDEIDQLLRKAGRRRSQAAEQSDRRGLYRRR
jgi:curved DNA-binding protein CbpA